MKKNSQRPSNLTFERPLVTVDLVIFSIVRDALSVLLVRRPKDELEPFAEQWALPGGFVDVHRDASLLACAMRKLQDKTGVVSPYLEQLGSWGGAQRDPRGWSTTHAYFALIQAPNRALPAPPTRVESAWHAVHEATQAPLAFDHATLLNTAVQRLRSKVEYTSLPAFLMAEPFTLPQLQHSYEVVLGRPVDKSAFRKRMLDASFLVEAGLSEATQGRAAMGYRIADRSQFTTFARMFRSGESVHL